MESWFDASRSQRQAAIHEELDRLPRVHRTVIILCGFERLPIERAARELRWPIRILDRRLSRALKHLRIRLVRRFYDGPVSIWDSDILKDMAAVVPRSLIESTIAAATGYLYPPAVSGSRYRDRKLPGRSVSP